MTINEFDAFWAIYSESFPDNEKRNRTAQWELFRRKEYHVNCIYREDALAGFVCFWDIGNYVFVEHLAVSGNKRGDGLGAQLMTQLINSGTPLVLEVEPPHDEISKRRIGFYERLGFHLNHYYHVQPPLQEGFEPVELLLMSYPNALSPNDTLYIEGQLQKVVYRTS